MRFWGKIYRHKHKLKDMVIEKPGTDLTRTGKVFSALEEFCYAFDIQVPIWLDSNIRDFKCFARTRFSADSFIEAIDFDYFEFQVIEED
ncbi:MAG: hypothetical protein ILP10_01655 [Lachnospiraceae bacterium]|nr:hypothetical protein [Lachnospiraceae bacterium]